MQPCKSVDLKHNCLCEAEPALMQVVNLPRGFAYVEFANREEAERARSHMDGGQLDGNVLRYALLRQHLS